MKITNYKEEIAAEKERDKLRKEIDILNDQIWTKQDRVNEIEEAIDDYNKEQSALDE